MANETQTSEPQKEVAANKWYAWSRILYGAEFDKTDPKLIIDYLYVEVGEEVTKEKLGIDDAGWQQIVDGGAVRNYQLPEDYRDANASPHQIMSAKIRAAGEGVDVGMLEPQLMGVLMRRPVNATEGKKEIDDAGNLTLAGNPQPN